MKTLILTLSLAVTASATNFKSATCSMRASWDGYLNHVGVVVVSQPSLVSRIFLLKREIKSVTFVLSPASAPQQTHQFTSSVLDDGRKDQFSTVTSGLLRSVIVSKTKYPFTGCELP